MSEVQAREIADTASVIVNGYAMSRDGSNISTIVQHRGRLTDREIRGIQAFIKVNYLEMYQLWATKSQTGFFVG